MLALQLYLEWFVDLNNKMLTLAPTQHKTTGDKLKTWNDALKILQESENNKKDVEMKDTKNEDKSECLVFEGAPFGAFLWAVTSYCVC